MSIITDMKPVTQELVYGSMDPCLLLAYTLVPCIFPHILYLQGIATDSRTKKNSLQVGLGARKDLTQINSAQQIVKEDFVQVVFSAHNVQPCTKYD